MITIFRSNIESLSSSIKCKESDLKVARADLKEAQHLESECNEKLTEAEKIITLLTQKR